MVQNVHNHQSTRHESFLRHPIGATVHEADHLREIADEGESPATPVILAGAAIVFVTPLAARVFLLVIGITHLA
jgi:hypothetical protein